MTLRLTGAQVTRVREADNRFHAEVASRGGNVQLATETLVEDVLEIVAESKTAAGSADVPCGHAGCNSRADFIILGKARCREHRTAL